jgi:hypothetical protein
MARRAHATYPPLDIVGIGLVFVLVLALGALAPDARGCRGLGDRHSLLSSCSHAAQSAAVHVEAGFGASSQASIRAIRVLSTG